MNFESETSYVGPLDLVLEVLGSEELLRQREKAAGAKGQVNYSGTPRDHTFSVQVPNNELPSAARSFMPNGLTAVLHGTVKELDEAGKVHGATLVYDIAVQGAPASGGLRFILADSGATTPAKIMGQIKVNVPFVGGRIEKSAVEHFEKMLARDTKIVNEEITRVRASRTESGGEVADTEATPEPDDTGNGDANGTEY